MVFCFVLVTRAEVFIWENYYPGHRDLDNRAHLGFLYEHIEIFSTKAR